MRKKENQIMRNTVPAPIDRDDAKAIVFAAKNVQDLQKEIAKKEVDSLHELREVEMSFDDMIGASTELRDTVGAFANIFSSMQESARKTVHPMQERVLV